MSVTVPSSGAETDRRRRYVSSAQIPHHELSAERAPNRLATRKAPAMIRIQPMKTAVATEAAAGTTIAPDDLQCTAAFSPIITSRR